MQIVFQQLDNFNNTPQIKNLIRFYRILKMGIIKRKPQIFIAQNIIHKFFQELIQIFISIRSHICSCQRTVQLIQCLTVLPDNQVIHTFKLIINCSHRVSGIIGKFSRRQKIKSLVYKQLPCLDNQINSYFLFCLRHFNPSVIKFSSLP